MSGAGELAGMLTERVRFERRAEARGAAGGWEYVAERWAGVELLSRTGQSALVAEARHSTRRWRILLRTGPSLAVGMRALWRGLELRVTGIEDDPAMADRLVVIVEEIAA